MVTYITDISEPWTLIAMLIYVFTLACLALSTFGYTYIWVFVRIERLYRRVAMTSISTTDLDSFVLREVNPTGKEIGRGAYGRVFEVSYEGTLCAAKEVHALLLQFAQGDGLKKIKEDFLSECQLWSTLRHPCIVQFLGILLLVLLVIIITRLLIMIK